MPSTDWLAPGLDRETIRAELERQGLAAPAEILEWFTWHNGCSGRERNIRHWYGPTSFHVQSLSQCLEIRDHYQEWARSEQEVGSPPEDSEEQLWDSSWLPLAWSGGTGIFAVDLAEPGENAPVLLHDHTAPGQKHPVLPSLAALISIWIEVLSNYCTWNSELGAWDMAFDQVPRELRRLL